MAHRSSNMIRKNSPEMLQPILLLLLLWCPDAILAGDEVSAYFYSSVTSTDASNGARICHSIEIRSVEDFAQLQNCTIVVGHVRIVNLQLNAVTEDTRAKLASAVEEITDYLLVHRVQGLSTMRKIFPRLTLIRGRELLFTRYSLVVYENRNLLTLGLVSLLRIQAGVVRVESNPQLCYVETVNWVLLLGNSTQQHFSLKSNKSPNQCPLCTSARNDTKVAPELPPETLEQHCWDSDAMQKTISSFNFDECPVECSLRGCDVRRNCCNDSCLSGCAVKICTLCANLRLGQKCADSCAIPYYEFQKRECISATQCREHGLIPFAGACLAQCPANFQQTPDSMGQTSCSLMCHGHYVIHTSKDLNNLRECVSIEGSLTIELIDIRDKITDLQQVLMSIKEITGYLKVVRTPQLISLSFLSNLDTIRGEELIDGKYALYVVDNYHLEQIWAPKQNVAILRGHVYFHLNPRLCYDKIINLESSLKSAERISIVDASPNSNGERVVCGSAVRVLNVTVEDFNSTAVRLKVEPMSADDKPVLIGYVHHYKEAPMQNVTLYDGRHGCGHDRWRMDITPNQNVRHIINNLRPYTQYAFFVKTLTMTDYHMQIDAYSKIQYFRTLPSKPGPIAKIYYHALSSSKLSVHWWPPRIPNGIIKKYVISFDKAADKGCESKSKTNGNTCECTVGNPDDSGPLPEDENYYNKEQIIYDEALPDLIYVPRPGENNKLNRLENRTKEAGTLNSADHSEHHADTNNTSFALNSTEDLNLTTNSSSNDRRLRTSRKASQGKSPNNINKFEKQRSKDNTDPDVAEAERNYQNYRMQMEKKAFAEQDTGPRDFPITKQPKICPQPNATVQYQLENLCKPLEKIDGVEIPGHVYTYTLANLEPEMTYRIGVRACVANLTNGCGSESVIYAKTVSKSMEKLLKDLKVFV